MSLSLLESRFAATTLWLGRHEVHAQPPCGAGRHSATGEPVHADEDDSRPAWQSSLDAMQRLLDGEPEKTRMRRIRLIVSNEFVRYVLTPWTAQRLTEREREQFVRALLSDQYGGREHEWLVRAEPERFEQPALAAAIDAELFSAAQSLAQRSGRRLISMVPALLHKLDAHRKELGKARCGWVVDASDGRLASLAFAGGCWAAVANERCAGAPPSLQHALLPVLRRDAIRLPGLLAGTVFIADSSGVAGVIDQTWPVVRLGGAALPS